MSADLIAILVFVMPGLVGAGTYRLLTVSRKIDQFDFVVFSFVLTVSSLLLAAFFQWQFFWSWGFRIELLPIADLKTALDGNSKELIQFKVYTVLMDYLFSVGFAITNLIGLALGIVLSRGINNGKIYRYLRNRGLTKRTGRIDIWQDMLVNSEWIVVTLNDGKKYLGYARYYSDSDDADKREIILAKCKELRLNSDGSNYEKIPLDSELIYFKISDIKSIESFKKD